MENFDAAALYYDARRQNDAQQVIDALPYASFLGMTAHYREGDWLFELPPKGAIVGNPTLPAIHGGAVAGFMEMSAITYLLMSLDGSKLANEPVIPRIVDFSIDYVRACRFQPTFASCELVRQGRRMANVGVRVWQRDPQVLTATARVHYLLD